VTTTLQKRHANLERIELGMARAEDYNTRESQEWAAKLYQVQALVEIGYILAGIEAALDVANDVRMGGPGVAP
jgi:hypothetical protein